MNRLKAILVAVIFLTLGSYRLAHRWWLRSHWQEAPATCDRVWVDESRTQTGTNYTVKVLYSYAVGGKTYQSQRFDLEDRGPIHGDPARSESIAAEWRAKASPTCWVDPHHPSHAVLDLGHDYEFDIAMLAIGLVAAAAAWGGTVLAFCFRLGRRWTSFATSPQAEQWWHSWLPTGGALLVLGASVIGLTVHEWIQSRTARSWIEVPSVIEECRLTYYSHEWQTFILYSYVWEGQSHRTNQVSFDTFSGSVTTAEKRIAEYPAGSHTVCFVDPASPTDAVLIRPEQPPWGMTAASIMVLATLFGGAVKARREWIELKQAPLASNSPKLGGTEDPDASEDSLRTPVLIPLPLPPTRREALKSRLASGLEVSAHLRRRFVRMAPWCLASGLLVIWLARDVQREWSLGVWPTISQWLALAALGLTGALPFLLVLMALRWRENRRLSKALKHSVR